VFIAGSTRETLGFAVERDLPLMLSLEPPEGRQLAIYAAVLAAKNRPSALARSSPARYVCIAAGAEQAEERARDLVVRHHQRRAEAARARGVEQADIPPMDVDKALREQYIFGAPDQCLAQVQTLERRLGVGQMRCVFNGGGLWDSAAALSGMTLFAQEVMPGLTAGTASAADPSGG